MRNKVVILFAGLMAAALVSSAATINFTADEGYVSGDLVNNSLWGGHTDYQVDVAGGVVTNFVKWMRAYYLEPLAADTNKIYSVSAAFRFTQISPQPTASYTALFGVELLNGAYNNAKSIRVVLNRQGYEDDRYNLQLLCNSTTGTSETITPNITADYLGINSAGGDYTSDLLQLSLSVFRGETADDWIAYISLYNLDTETEVRVGEIAFSTGSDMYDIANLYAGINAGLGADANITDLQMSVFSADVDDVPSDGSVHFSAAEGYTYANLADQTDWDGWNDCLPVNPVFGYVYGFESAPVGHRAYFATPEDLVSSNTYHLSANFKFMQSDPGALTGAKAIFGIEYLDAANKSADSVRLEFKRSINTEYYNIAMSGNSYQETDKGGDFWTGLTADQLGFTGAGDFTNSSGNLELSMDLTYTGGTSWYAELALSNGVTEIKSGWITFTTPEGFDLGSLYGAVSPGSAAEAAVTNMQMTLFEYSRITPPPPPGYAGWITGYDVSETNSVADPDGDGRSNLEEYAFGGDPSDPENIGESAAYRVIDIAGTNWFEFSHVTLADTNSGISYVVETCDNLIDGIWETNGVVIETGVRDSVFNVATNRISMEDSPAGFVRVRIEETTSQ